MKDANNINQIILINVNVDYFFLLNWPGIFSDLPRLKAFGIVFLP